MNSISLSDLTSRIQETIKLNFEVPVWIRAEISELRENYSGHCYLELVEKDADTGTLLAKTKATIWTSTYRMLKPYFENSTGETLRAGLNVLIAVTVEFHGVYGFNLNVRDIDPVFTIGEMAARRLKIIRQLEQDGVFDMNREIPFPHLPQRIAIISSATAAGYDDFCDQLKNDSSHFAFYSKLFPAVMQGEQAQGSIITALEKIYEHVEFFDVVVIIRGGGATADLSCFDSYELALNCAQFPLPVVTGIGHQRDYTILDMIAHTSVKTPTAVAEFLIEKMKLAQIELYDIVTEIEDVITIKIAEQNRFFDDIKWNIKQNLQNKSTKKLIYFEKQKNRLTAALKNIFNYQQNKIQLIGKGIESHSPAFLLQHGYTITTLNGKRITSIKQVLSHDKIRTFTFDGNFESEVK